MRRVSGNSNSTPAADGEDQKMEIALLDDDAALAEQILESQEIEVEDPVKEEPQE